ncbi:hypothetical protein DC3_56710 [Deinococcus cellulosilyticus NBRC 106333 = KACC 11606]|uniref:Type II CBASS E2 protein domain-containing protein n=1 Tax=Deinococcus cellulosilyticus (strain DSM 18568 / NBRC 106333 / KACC 11606 / 5516J-15) TaxID=1223518 RepID=A0A511NBV3_DEIC1|nr:hypothetical protein DC3_56710 [Deinococcus cellulosilyticus NBRC 106333 = KACC 11606]
MTFKPKPLPLVVQAILLRRHHPSMQVKVKGTTLQAHFEVRPSEMGGTYQVLLQHQQGSPPEVHVLSPTLQHRDGVPPPHLYRNGALCLFYPPSGEWTPQQALATTLIPWTVDWLFYYEIWLVTGTWEGGGRH